MNNKQAEVIKYLDRVLFILFGLILLFSFRTIVVHAGSIVTRCGGSGCGYCPNGGNSCTRPGGYGGIFFTCNLNQMEIENGFWKCEHNPVFLGTGGGTDSINTGQTCGGQQIDVCEGSGSGCTGGPGGRLRDFIVYRDEFCVSASPTPTPPPPPPQSAGFGGYLYCENPGVPIYGGYTVDLVGDGQPPIVVSPNNAHFITNVQTTSNISDIRIVSAPPGAGEFTGPFCADNGYPTDCSCNSNNPNWANCGNPTQHNLGLNFSYNNCTPQPARSCNVRTLNSSCIPSGSNAFHRVSWNVPYSGFNNLRATGRYDAPPYNNFPGPEDIVQPYTYSVGFDPGLNSYYAYLSNAAASGQVQVQPGIQYNYTLTIQNGTSPPDCSATSTFTCSAAATPGSMVVNIRDTQGNPVTAERICYGGTHPNYGWSTSIGNCQNNVSSFTINPIALGCGNCTDWHYGAQLVDLPSGYTIVSTNPNYSSLLTSVPINPPYPATALVNRDLANPEAGRTNVWAYYWDSFWYTSQRSVTITVNNNTNPTASAVVTTNEQCTLANGATLSGRISGILNDTKSINNPIRVTTTHTDANGQSDIYEMGISLFPQGGDPNNIGASTHAKVRRVGPGNFSKLVLPSNSMGLTDPRVIVNINGSSTQVARYIANVPADAIAYINVVSVNESVPNQITVVWEIALLNPSSFNGPLNIRALTQDNSGGTSGWVNSPGSLEWEADLTRPVFSQPPSINMLSPTSFQTSYNVTDNLGLYNNGFAKQCAAVGLVGSENITLTKGAANLLLNTNNAFVTCFDNNMLPLTETYGITNASTNGNVSFRYTATDRACNEVVSTVTTTSTPSPWLMTSMGDAFTGGTYTMRFPATISNVGSLPESGQQPNFSRYLFTQYENSLPSSSSLRNYSSANYDDLNDTPRIPGQSNWYDYLRNKVLDGTPASRVHNISALTFTVPINAASVMQTWLGSTIDQNQVYALNVAGNAAFSGTLNCNMRLVIIVAGNLTLTPDVTAPGNTQGCIFVVRGTTTINAGSNKGSNDTTPITNYDLVQGFILTNSITTVSDPSLDGLLIEGAVVANVLNSSGTANFNRTLSIIRNQQAPAEIIRYDSRYLYIFGDLFNYEKSYNIRETQFIRSLSD